MKRRTFLTVAALAPLAGPRLLCADTNSGSAGWPSYAGANGAFAAPANIALFDDMTKARLVWSCEEHRVGYGKTATTGVPADYADLPPGGIASPIVAGGALIQAYFSPTGDVIDEVFKERDQGRDPSNQRYKVSADDVVLALDAATGKTRWKHVAAGKGVSLPMGKRGGYGVTPVAADGKVFSIGTTGRIYALDLASGKQIWVGHVGPRHTQLEAAKRTALEKKRVMPDAGVPFSAVYGMPLVIDGVLVAPDLGRGLLGLDTATGKPLWTATGELLSSFNMPAPLRIAGRGYVATINRLGQLRLIDVRDGKVLWTHGLKSQHLKPPVGIGDIILAFESNPKFSGADINKVDKNNPDLNPVGVLCAFRATEKGPEKLWSEPAEIAHVLSVDAGPSRRVIARDGLVYHLTNPEKTAELPGGDPTKKHVLHIIELATGKMLRSEPFPFPHFHLWGDRVVGMSDIQHRPRKVNPEIWQLYTSDPKDFRKLGAGWHINGPQPVHTATGGYELPLYDAFSDGFLFARTVQGIRCYDLRK